MQQSRIKSFDGTELAVSLQGPATGAPILFSHYLGGAAKIWTAQMQALSERYRVIRYDLRGHGQSDAPAGPYDAAMLGQDALAVLGAFGLERAHVVGLSLGGIASMWLAAHHPNRIDRLVLANTTPFIPNKPMWDELITRAGAEGLDGIATQTLTGWLSDGFKAQHPGRLTQLIEIMRAMPVAGYAGCCAVLRDVDLRADLARIRAATLVIGGAEDGPRGAAAPIMAQAITGARLAILPDAAHLSAIENPEAFNAALLEHLT